MWSLLLIMTAMKAEETCPMESYLRDSIAVNLLDYYLATSELVAICRVKTKKGNRVQHQRVVIFNFCFIFCYGKLLY